MTPSEKAIALMADGRERTPEEVASACGSLSAVEALVEKQIFLSRKIRGHRVLREDYDAAIRRLKAAKPEPRPTISDMQANRDRLTRRARELHAEGFSVRQIAAVLDVARSTALRYVQGA